MKPFGKFRICFRARKVIHRLGRMPITWDALESFAQDAICWSILFYGDNCPGDRLLRASGLDSFARNRDSFSTQIGSNNMICIRKTVPPASRTYLLAHELGHILLEHTLGNLQPQDEAAANCFASMLLKDRSHSHALRKTAIPACILLVISAGIWAMVQITGLAPNATVHIPAPTSTAPAIVPDAPQLSPESTPSLSAFSASSNTDKLVYFTVSGKKFHNVYCYTIKGKSTFCAPMSEARKKGLEPCLACRPDM